MDRKGEYFRSNLFLLFPLIMIVSTRYGVVSFDPGNDSVRHFEEEYCFEGEKVM